MKTEVGKSLFSKLLLSKTVTFFSIGFTAILSIIYFQARKENRTDFRFVITNVHTGINKHVAVENNDEEFNFCNFDSYDADLIQGDSLVKKAFSKTLFLYRKDPISNLYKLHLKMKEAGTFPIDWQ
jgi:hypothetical protein